MVVRVWNAYLKCMDPWLLFAKSFERLQSKWQGYSVKKNRVLLGSTAWLSKYSEICTVCQFGWKTKGGSYHTFVETGRDVAPRTFINIGILQKWNASKMGVIWHCGVLRETDTEVFPPGSAFLCLHTDSVASEVWAQLQYYEKWQGCVGRGRRHLDNCEDVDIWTLTRSQCSPLCGEHHNHRRIQTFCNCCFFSYFFS